MAYTLQQLSDFEDIRTLKHRYYRGIDTADEALLGGLFTDDVSVEYRGGGYLVRLAGREAMLDFLMNSFHADSVAMHQGHMPEISLLSDDEAEGIWYLEDLHPEPFCGYGSLHQSAAAPAHADSWNRARCP